MQIFPNWYHNMPLARNLLFLPQRCAARRACGSALVGATNGIFDTLHNIQTTAVRTHDVRVHDGVKA